MVAHSYSPHYNIWMIGGPLEEINKVKTTIGLRIFKQILILRNCSHVFFDQVFEFREPNELAQRLITILERI